MKAQGEKETHSFFLKIVLNTCMFFCRPEELHRIRVEHMERQLANLTGLVQKALVQNPQANTAVNQQMQDVGHYRNGQFENMYENIQSYNLIEGLLLFYHCISKSYWELSKVYKYFWFGLKLVHK